MSKRTKTHYYCDHCDKEIDVETALKNETRDTKKRGLHFCNQICARRFDFSETMI